MQVWTNCKQALPLRTHTIVYEELIADAEGSLRPLIDFLGLDWREELLDHRATAAARGGIGTPSYNQVTQPLLAPRAAVGNAMRSSWSRCCPSFCRGRNGSATATNAPLSASP